MKNRNVPKIVENIIESRVKSFGLMALLVLTAYAFVVHAPFRSMDDTTSIVQNPLIRDIQNIPQILSSSFFGDRSYYRPLVTLSYMTEYHFFGLRSFFYNLDNIILHILNAWLVFLLIERIFKDRAIGFWTALLYAIHPIAWESVANISGRAILLNAFFYFSTFWIFIQYLEKRKIIWLAASVMCLTLALLCKESAAMFPIIAAIYLKLNVRRGERPWLALLPHVLLVIGFIILRSQLGITELFGWGSWHAMFLGFMSFACGVITYLRLFVLPVDLYFDRSHEVFTHIFDIQLIATLVFWPAVFTWLWIKRSKLDGRVLFMVFWFLLELAPVSQIVTSLGVQPGYISLAEHFLYVPSAAAFALLVVMLRKIVTFGRAQEIFSAKIIAIAIGGIFIFLYLTTIQQNIYASSESAMLKRSLAYQPVNSRVQYSLGMHYVHRGMFEVAEKHFHLAVVNDPWNVRAAIALGKSLCDQGRWEEGIAVYESILGFAGSQTELLQENLRLSKEILRQKQNPVYLNPK